MTITTQRHALDYRYHRGAWEWFTSSCVTGRYRVADSVVSASGVTARCRACKEIVYDSSSEES